MIHSSVICARTKLLETAMKTSPANEFLLVVFYHRHSQSQSRVVAYWREDFCGRRDDLNTVDICYDVSGAYLLLGKCSQPPGRPQQGQYFSYDLRSVIFQEIKQLRPPGRPQQG